MSAGPSTAPVGLCGELIMIMRVRGVTARRMASQSTAYWGNVNDTTTGVPPASSIAGTYES